MIEVNTIYYPNGNKQVEVYRLNEKIHNPDGPAYTSYYNNGNIHCKEFYINNRYHNENGPAITEYYPNGNIKYTEYHLNGKIHNSNGPAYVSYFINGNKRYEQYIENNITSKLVNFTEAGKKSSTYYFYNNMKFRSKKKMEQYIKLNNIS